MNDEIPTVEHVYWLGGSPCSGKSSIADHLAATHGLDVYRCDDAYYRHQSLISPADQPVWSRLAGATCDGLWMRPVGQQVDEELAVYREQFPFILADLTARPRSRPVIAEGAALLPELIDGVASPRRAIWMVPEPDFQVTHYARREWRHDVLQTCTDPEQAWRNWMDRDIGFARHVAGNARERGFEVLVVDGSRPLDEMIRVVETYFGL